VIGESEVSSVITFIRNRPSAVTEYCGRWRWVPLRRFSFGTGPPGRLLRKAYLLSVLARPSFSRPVRCRTIPFRQAAIVGRCRHLWKPAIDFRAQETIVRRSGTDYPHPIDMRPTAHREAVLWTASLNKETKKGFLYGTFVIRPSSVGMIVPSPWIYSTATLNIFSRVMPCPSLSTL